MPPPDRFEGRDARARIADEVDNLGSRKQRVDRVHLAPVGRPLVSPARFAACSRELPPDRGERGAQRRRRVDDRLDHRRSIKAQISKIASVTGDLFGEAAPVRLIPQVTNFIPAVVNVEQKKGLRGHGNARVGVQ